MKMKVKKGNFPTRQEASTKDMVSQLKDDLRRSGSSSYSGDGIALLLNGTIVKWYHRRGRLYRVEDYTDTVVSRERVRSFKYQGIFGANMAFEIIGAERYVGVIKVG